jgi:hypothetical protein
VERVLRELGVGGDARALVGVPVEAVQRIREDLRQRVRAADQQQ